jgi:SAM-dependent methyltransferase
LVPSVLRDWRLKAAAQHLFSAVPGGVRLNYAFQRHLTHGLPISDAHLDEVIHTAQVHLDALGAHDPSLPLFEFGAGWDLGRPLALHCLGVERQVVVDIRPLARPELVDDLVRRLGQCSDQLVRVPPPRGRLELLRYLDQLGIDFRAPADARSTGLATDSIAGITSTNTVEHIPAPELDAIFRECLRILAPGGRASLIVDYEDHYAKFDPRLHAYSFLGISEPRWRWANPSLHFQNRLRHSQVRDLVIGAGFMVVQEEIRLPTQRERRELEGMKLAVPFDTMDLDDVAVMGSHLVLEMA